MSANASSRTQSRRPPAQRGRVLRGDGLTNMKASHQGASFGAPERFVDQCVETASRRRAKFAADDIANAEIGELPALKRGTLARTLRSAMRSRMVMDLRVMCKHTQAATSNSPPRGQVKIPH
jgi:hypothetical protein